VDEGGGSPQGASHENYFHQQSDQQLKGTPERMKARPAKGRGRVHRIEGARLFIIIPLRSMKESVPRRGMAKRGRLTQRGVDTQGGRAEKNYPLVGNRPSTEVQGPNLSRHCLKRNAPLKETSYVERGKKTRSRGGKVLRTFSWGRGVFHLRKDADSVEGGGGSLC